MGPKQTMAITDASCSSYTKPIFAADSMVFIYFFDQNKDFIDASERILKHAERGGSTVVTSIISLTESLSPLKYRDDEGARSTIINFFYLTPNIHIIDATREVALEAARLRREYTYLRTPDAIQLATAITAHADTFITNDARLTKLSLPGLTIRTL